MGVGPRPWSAETPPTPRTWRAGWGGLGTRAAAGGGGEGGPHVHALLRGAGPEALRPAASRPRSPRKDPLARALPVLFGRGAPPPSRV